MFSHHQLLGVPSCNSYFQCTRRASLCSYHQGHWELQIWRTLWRWRIAWRCRSIGWERPWWRDGLFFDERLADHFGCQVTSWTHLANLPSPGFEKNKTKRKQMKRKASLPMSLDSVLILIILNIIDNHITKHNQHDLPPRSPRFRSRGSHPWWNPSPKHVPQEEKENELEGHIPPVTTRIHHLEFTDIKFWCTSRNKSSNMHLVMNTSLSNAVCTTKPHKSWENSHQHLDEIRSRPATTRTSAWKHPPIRRSP